MDIILVHGLILKKDKSFKLVNVNININPYLCLIASEICRFRFAMVA